MTSKKQLKKRIKELEFENEMLRAMRPYPVYYRVYSGSSANVTLDDVIEKPIIEETTIKFDGNSQDSSAVDVVGYIRDSLQKVGYSNAK